MQTNIYSVYDSKAACFMPPFFLHNDSLAQRAMLGALMEESHQFYKHAEDFTLYKLGVFDDGVGVIESEISPQAICNLSMLKVAMNTEEVQEA